MKISVIIPTHHRNEQLAQCLDRLGPGRQTLDASQYEVIVTDDGSRSTAEAILRERYPWARWVAGPCRGPAANRNNGALHAQGQWLAFTDDDCLPDPGWLGAFLEAAAVDGEVLEGKTICRQGIRSCLDESPENIAGGGFPSCNLMIRRDTFERLGRFDEDFSFWCEDLYFHTLVRRAGLIPRFVAAAVIDHPHRRRPSGWKMGLRWEGRILLWYKEGNTASVWRFFPLHCLKVRIAQALVYPIQWDTFRAGAALVTELICLLFHLRQWDRKYRKFCPAPKPAGSKLLNADAG